jgi:hypothetical protein
MAATWHAGVVMASLVPRYGPRYCQTALLVLTAPAVACLVRCVRHGSERHTALGEGPAAEL